MDPPYIPNMDIVNWALFMERVIANEPAGEMQQTHTSTSNESDPNIQSDPGKIKHEKKKCKGVNWYAHMPKGPPPRKTPEQEETSKAAKSQLRNFIAKRTVDKPVPSPMSNFPNLSPFPTIPAPRVYQFHQTIVPRVYADIPSPSSSPHITHVIPFTAPEISSEELTPPAFNLSPLQIFHGTGELAKAVDYRTCDPNCWCGPPTSQK